MADDDQASSPAQAEELALTPLELAQGDDQGWSDRAPMLFRVARWWTRKGPRAKGFLPRIVGRKLLKSMRCLVKTEHGAQLACWPGGLDVYAHIWANRGTYEPQVVDACHHLVRPDESVLDIGANVGVVSLELMARRKGALKISTFEPQPQLAKHLAISAKLNGWDGLRVFNALLGDESGEKELFVPAHTIHASMVSRSKHAQALRCPMRRLDDLLAAGVIGAPSLIKIDVEGAEMMVFGGAKKLLSEHQPSVVFESDANMERFGYQRRDLFDLLREHGDYRFWQIRDDRSGCDPLPQDADPATFPDGNFIALSPRYTDRIEALEAKHPG